MSDLEFTGERLVPSRSPSDLETEHRARYEFASRFLEGLKVIDIGCGEGYGSHMLSAVASEVTGVDIDEESIEHAREKYKADNLKYETADVQKLPFSDDEFNAGLCFEVIEHIENPVELLREATRVIETNGTFIVSTPNAAVKVSSQPNPYHVKEFQLIGFLNLLRGHFPVTSYTIDVYGQFLKSKEYTKMGVAFKNLYLGFKGVFGLKAKSKPVMMQEDEGPVHEYEFLTENKELAEYLVAVVKERKRPG